MELALDVNFGEKANWRSKVSILVFVELALDAGVSRVGHQVCRVSILVFVELALDDQRQLLLHLLGVEFQSLFSWNLLLMLQAGLLHDRSR